MPDFRGAVELGRQAHDRVEINTQSAIHHTLGSLPDQAAPGNHSDHPSLSTSKNLVVGGSLTVGGIKIQANDGTGGTQYTGLNIVNGSRSGYSGFRFQDEGMTFMVDGAGAAGIYKDAGAWAWYFDNAGVLQVGTVPWGKITGVPASVGSAAGYLVQYQSPSGYIYTNYINSTADAAAGRAVYVAGQNGDNFMRWYNAAAQLVGYVWMSDRTDYRLNIGWNGTYWRCQSLAWPSGAYQGGLIVDRADALSQKDAKINVAPAQLDYESIFNIDWYTFDYDPEHQQVSPTLVGDKRHFGSFVEELEELGLEEFVMYDPHGRPWSIDYGSLAATMIPVVKNLIERVEALEAA